VSLCALACAVTEWVVSRRALFLKVVEACTHFVQHFWFDGLAPIVCKATCGWLGVQRCLRGCSSWWLATNLRPRKRFAPSGTWPEHVLGFRSSARTFLTSWGLELQTFAFCYEFGAMLPSQGGIWQPFFCGPPLDCDNAVIMATSMSQHHSCLVSGVYCMYYRQFFFVSNCLRLSVCALASAMTELVLSPRALVLKVGAAYANFVPHFWLDGLAPIVCKAICDWLGVQRRRGCSSWWLATNLRPRKCCAGSGTWGEHVFWLQVLRTDTPHCMGIGAPDWYIPLRVWCYAPFARWHMAAFLLARF